MVPFRKDATDSELKRQTKGLAIASLGSCINRINKLRYKVKSQSDENKWYEVIKQYGRNVGGRRECCLNADILLYNIENYTDDRFIKI